MTNLNKTKITIKNGQRYKFKARFVKLYKKNSQPTIIVTNIREVHSGQLFRDHAHIKLKKGMLEKIQKTQKGCEITFTAIVKSYSRILIRKGYQKRQRGLSNIKKLRIKI